MPINFALGFAAFLCFYRLPDYPVNDDNADYFMEKWQRLSPEDLVWQVLSDKAKWGADLTALPGFAEKVTHFVLEILDKGAKHVLNSL